MWRRLLTAWQRYWFTPASLTALGVSRIALVGIVLYLHQGNRLLRAALVPAALWQPVPLLCHCFICRALRPPPGARTHSSRRAGGSATAYSTRPCLDSRVEDR
jgi:hypothetical protein